MGDSGGCILAKLDVELHVHHGFRNRDPERATRSSAKTSDASAKTLNLISHVKSQLAVSCESINWPGRPNCSPREDIHCPVRLSTWRRTAFYRAGFQATYCEITCPGNIRDCSDRHGLLASFSMPGHETRRDMPMDLMSLTRRVGNTAQSERAAKCVAHTSQTTIIDML